MRPRSGIVPGSLGSWDAPPEVITDSPRRSLQTPASEGVWIWKMSSDGASLKRMLEDNKGLTPTNRRYRALLDVSSAMVEQPTVKAVLRSLRDVLSSCCRRRGSLST
jgi:hypothetical protein